MQSSIKLNAAELRQVLEKHFGVNFETIIIEDSEDNAPNIAIQAEQHRDEIQISANLKIWHLPPITKTITITFNY